MFIHTFYFFIHMPVPDQLFPRASLERLVDSDCLQLRKDKQKKCTKLEVLDRNIQEKRRLEKRLLKISGLD